MSESGSPALTEDQRRFAAENHNLIYRYLYEQGRAVDDYYDIAALGFLSAVRRYMTKPELRRYAFSTIAWRSMKQSIASFHRAETRREAAERRYKELLGRGLPADLAEVRQDIEQRDYQDTHRETSPLRQAEDAKYLDTTGLSIEQVLQQVLQLAEAAE